MSLRERAREVARVAAATGRSRASVLRELVTTWGAVTPGELHRVNEFLASMPVPRDPEVVRAAREGADDTETERLAHRMVSDIDAFRRFRDLRASNPHAAALFMNANATAISRGRALDTETTDEGGPEAA